MSRTIFKKVFLVGKKRKKKHEICNLFIKSVFLHFHYFIYFVWYVFRRLMYFYSSFNKIIIIIVSFSLNSFKKYSALTLFLQYCLQDNWLNPIIILLNKRIIMWNLCFFLNQKWWNISVVVFKKYLRKKIKILLWKYQISYEKNAFPCIAKISVNV